MRSDHEAGNDVGAMSGVRPPGRRSRRGRAWTLGALAAGAATAVSSPLLAQAPSFPHTAWTDVAASVVSETGYRSGFGTGVTAAGESVELRPGSPFVRIGDQILQLANAPVLDDGRLLVPDELFGRPEFAAESGGSALPPVVRGDDARAPGPWRVVIDPGHGGRHPGTVSPRSGTKEKDLTLAISRMIYEELSEAPGIEPWLTRTTDRFIDVPDRPIMAVERQGDMFVSIHIDAQERGTSARGFTTYYLGPSRTEEGRRHAMRENTVPGAENRTGPDLDQLEFILAGLDQGTHLDESRRFGGFVQNELRARVDSPDRGVRPGPFWVLMRATSNMPTVLVELGFITNPQDERQLRDPGHQRVLAEGVATAIKEYLDEKQDRLDALAGGR